VARRHADQRRHGRALTHGIARSVRAIVNDSPFCFD
jgi:hypothetical protein